MPFIPDDQKYSQSQQEGISPDDVSFRSKVAGGLSKFSSIIRGSESARGGLQIGNQARQTQAQNQQDFQKAQELTAQAKLETDEVKKQQLLDQARAIMGEAGKRAANLRQTEKEVMYSADIDEKDLEKSNAEFALRRGGAFALEAGSLMVPGPQAAAAKAKGRIAQAALKGGISSGLSGAAKQAEEAESVSEATGKTAKSAATGALLSGLFASIGELRNIGKKGANSKKALEKREKALDTWKEQTKDNQYVKHSVKQHGGFKKMHKTAIEEGIERNSTKKLAKQFNKYGPEFEREVNGILAKNKNVGMNFQDALKEALDGVDDMYGSTNPARAEAMKSFLKSNYKNTQVIQTPDSFNRLRSALDKTTKGKPVDDISSLTNEAQKTLVTAMRKQMKDKIPALSKPMDKYATMATLLEAMNKDKSPNLFLTLVGGGGAALAGRPDITLAYGAASYGASALRTPQVRRRMSTEIMKRAVQTPQATNVPNILTSAIGKIEQ